MKKVLKGAQSKKNPGARGKFKREQRKMEKEQGKYKKGARDKKLKGPGNKGRNCTSCVKGARSLNPSPNRGSVMSVKTTDNL